MREPEPVVLAAEDSDVTGSQSLLSDGLDDTVKEPICGSVWRSTWG